ncbi:MAG: DsrE/DsrF/DrsH-like family protein [Thermoplasmata archaeon]
MADKATIIMQSGYHDRLYSALIVGTGALSMGMDASIYFTFWGLDRLKKGGLEKGPLSRMNMLGIGKWMINRKMKKAKVRSLKELMDDFTELGGKVLACDMTMDIMGVDSEDLDHNLIGEYCAVGTYIKEARESDITLFL